MNKIELVYDGQRLTLPKELLPDSGEPQSHHFQSTDCDNLIELAGRTCYDSCKSITKTRGTKEYHDHINEVFHRSTQEHVNLVVAIPFDSSDRLLTLLKVLSNRPGISYRIENDYSLRICYNIRSINDWDQFDQFCLEEDVILVNSVKETLLYHAKQKCPFAVLGDGINSLRGKIVEPKYNTEIWLSFYIWNVSRGFCYDDQTEVLTNNGWKLFKDTDIEKDYFATLNTNNYIIEFQKATNKTVEDWEDKLYYVHNSMVNLCVTPNHRMLIQPIDTQKYRRGEQEFIIKSAKEIDGKRVNYLKTGTWVGKNIKWYTVSGVTRKHGYGTITTENQTFDALAFIEFLGYFIAEGFTYHTKGSSYQIILCQNEGNILDKMKKCLEILGLSYSIKNDKNNTKQKQLRICNHALFLFLNQECKKLSYNKRVPSFIKELQPVLIQKFIDAIIDGDGNIHNNGHKVIYTSSKLLADDLQELILKLSLSASIRIDDRVNKPRFGKWAHIKQTRPNYIVSIANKKSQTPTVNGRYDNDQWIDYNGKVYCVTVPNGILYVRRNGIPVWSGNSHEWVRHKFHTAVSQRSTRYVDESENDWAWHPLFEKFNIQQLQIELDAKKTYKDFVEYFQDKLTSEGLDKFIARKASRGAARGILGNALSTEMIWSASLDQIKRILLQRANEGADGEIRLLSNNLFEIVSRLYPKEFVGWNKTPCKDGIGYALSV